MSIICKDIISIMNKMANPKMAEDWDNVGLILGNPNSMIENILLSLDINDEVIDEAIHKNCNMIITHHPFIFKPIKNIDYSTTLGHRIFKLIKHDISVFCAHTNLDMAKNGTNDTFAKLLNLQNICNLCDPIDGINGLGKVGDLIEEQIFSSFIEKVKSVLKLERIVISGDISKKVRRIGIGTGKCSSNNYIFTAKEKGCDCYITSDIGYHDAQFAIDMDICLIDATHYKSEVIVLPSILDYVNQTAIENDLKINIIISEVDGQTLKIV